ncbi:unnamed protein product [Mytilus edulis]|uniref:Endonuclease/exonuclease/phosphatase domain-containing protein n=1 Tax=Mytilus edulis TaxID=6550 RepID=A0A8S3R430_MYTED|nr:unnamed protein product [Mytilus edulis]
MTGEDKVAVKVITLMLPALEVLITTKQDDRLNKHDVAINKLQAQVRNVLYENDSLNQYSRRENVRISNVPEADGEDLTNILIEIAGSVGVVIKPDNINAIHRIGPKREGKARQVIARFVHLDIFDEILEKIIDITVNKNYQVCLLGDFNAHTGTHDDFIIVNDTILDSLLIDENSRKYMNSINALYELGIPIKRSSKDISNINNYGHKLLEFCKNLDLYIVNGRISNDQLVGAVTTSKNTLIDYAIVSPMLFKCISYFNIENFDPILSDIHCPVVIHFDTSVILESVDTLSHDDNSNVVYKSKWKNVETVNNVILNCNSIIKNAADKADMIVEFKPKNSRPGVRSKKCKPYFNQDCYLKRKAYRKM